MTNQPKSIFGAGLSGLIAAHAWPQLPVLEADVAPRDAHHALLRFRSDGVSKLVGIPFRKVRVHKGMWFMGKFRAPTINAANMYAQKVTGHLSGDRSIWSLEPVDRFIAPSNFYSQLVVSCRDRIHWGVAADQRTLRDCISTIPLPIALNLVGLNVVPGAGMRPLPSFDRAAIRVRRYVVRRADVFQTVYFPSPATAMYRASITGDMLIVESVLDPQYPSHEDEDLEAVTAAFGLQGSVDKIDEVDQRYGKIVSLESDIRNALLYELTAMRSIYSLGRFATWRNILLDDVVNDIAVIKALSRAPMHKLALHAAR